MNEVRTWFVFSPLHFVLTISSASAASRLSVEAVAQEVEGPLAVARGQSVPLVCVVAWKRKKTVMRRSSTLVPDR